MGAVLALALLGAIIFIGFLAEVLFRRSKIPDVLILILVGILLAQFFQLDSLQGIIPAFTTFALIFILFEGALRLDAKQLFIHLPKSLLLTFVSFVLAVGAALGLGMIMGLGFTTSLYLGFILGGISSAVVIPMIRFLGLTKKTGSILTLESAVSDVLCIVSTVLFTEILVLKQFDTQNVLNSFFATILIALAIGAGVGWVWQAILKKHAPANVYFLTIALLLLVYAATEYVQANGAIACLAFGIVLGNAKKVYESLHPKDNGEEEVRVFSRQVLTHQARAFYAEISFFVKTFFFIYLGMLIDFSSPKAFMYGFVLTAGFFLIRPFAVLVSRTVKDLKEKAVMEVLIPKGLAAAVLASIPLQAGIPGTEVIPNIVVAAIFLSIVLTAVFVFIIQKEKFFGIYRWGTPDKPKK